mmetsp:Transcript_22900/g.28214  ORF Transcript_22900/g.28214 Transcript_22900/m.28214 type:complete len:83 (-) Transcript_22900:351-599(-)
MVKTTSVIYDTVVNNKGELIVKLRHGAKSWVCSLTMLVHHVFVTCVNVMDWRVCQIIGREIMKVATVWSDVVVFCGRSGWNK